MSIVNHIFINNELKRTAKSPRREWFKDGGVSHYICIEKVLDLNRDVLEPGVVLIGFSRDSEYLISYTLTPCNETSENDFYFEERNRCSVQLWKFSFHSPLYKSVDLAIGPIESAFDNIETIEAGPLFIVHSYDQVTEYSSHEMISVFPNPLIQQSHSYSFKSAFISFDLHSSCRNCGFPSSLVMQCTDVPGYIVVNNGNTVSGWLFKKYENSSSKIVTVTKRIMTFVDIQKAAFSLVFKHFKNAFSKTVTGFDSIFMCSSNGFFVIIHVLASICEKEVIFKGETHHHDYYDQGQDSELDKLFYDEDEKEEKSERFKDSFVHIRAVLFLDYAGLRTRIDSVSVQRNVSPTLTIEKVVEADRKSASNIYSEQIKNHPWTCPFHCTNATVASGMESLPILHHPLLPTGLLGFQSVL